MGITQKSNYRGVVENTPNPGAPYKGIIMNIKMEENPIRCRIKNGWMHDGKMGYYYGSFYKDQWWAIVVWDDEEDPDFFKTTGLEIENGWTNIKMPVTINRR